MLAEEGNQDRDEEQRDQRQRARHRLQRTAQQQAPLAAGDILQHQHDQAAAREVEAGHVAHQVGAQDVVAALMRKGKGQREQREHSRNRSADASATQPARAAQSASPAAPAARGDRGCGVPRVVRVQMPFVIGFRES